jgi:hypothetical protein
VGDLLKHMSDYISKLIKDYEGTNYEQFVRYLYLSFQREIDAGKGKEKDKYIKIRNDILKYIVSNKANVTLELRRTKYK